MVERRIFSMSCLKTRNRNRCIMMILRQAAQLNRIPPPLTLLWPENFNHLTCIQQIELTCLRFQIVIGTLRFDKVGRFAAVDKRANAQFRDVWGFHFHIALVHWFFGTQSGAVFVRCSLCSSGSSLSIFGNVWFTQMRSAKSLIAFDNNEDAKVGKYEQTSLGEIWRTICSDYRGSGTYKHGLVK